VQLGGEADGEERARDGAGVTSHAAQRDRLHRLLDLRPARDEERRDEDARVKGDDRGQPARTWSSCSSRRS
jgi:hypothetical protein